MKIIFVSTDGVFTNQRYLELISKRGIGYMSNYQNQIDKKKITLINYLVNKTKALVVASGSWRLQMNLDKLNDTIHKSGATFEISDTTPYIYKLDNTKPADHVDELDRFIYNKAKNGIDIDDFVILDDRREWKQFNSRLVRVNYDQGLKPVHIERCLDLFGVPRKASIG